MKASDLLVLQGAVFIAPHINSTVAICLSAIAFITSIFAFRGEK